MAEKKVAKKAEAKPKEKVEKAAKPAQPKMHKRSILGRKKTEAEISRNVKIIVTINISTRVNPFFLFIQRDILFMNPPICLMYPL